MATCVYGFYFACVPGGLLEFGTVQNLAQKEWLIGRCQKKW